MNKAARRFKGGRPRKQNAPREADGRIDRSWAANQNERAAMETALEARQRVFGLNETQARDPLGGSTIGRMVLQGDLTRAQGQMAVTYQEVTNAYQRAICAPVDEHQPRTESTGDGDYVDFCARARARYDGMIDALGDLCAEQRSRSPVLALDLFIAKDKYNHTMVGDLRLALNRLHRHFVDGSKRGKRA